MPVSNFILQHWDDQQIVFAGNLNLIRWKQSKTAVHDLRVAVKKLRSYLRLREIITGAAWKDFFAATKTLFSTLGKHRDIEMSLSLFSKQSRKENLFLPSFKKYLKANLSLTRGWIKKAVIEYNEKELESLTVTVHSSLSVFTDEELQSMVKEYAEGVFKKIQPLAEDFKKNAHEIRKLLKDVYYWLRARSVGPVPDRAEMNAIEKTLANLGKWQDHFVFQKKLRGFRKEYLVKGADEWSAAKQLGNIACKAGDGFLETANTEFKKLFK